MHLRLKSEDLDSGILANFIYAELENKISQQAAKQIGPSQTEIYSENMVKYNGEHWLMEHCRN